MRCGPDASAPVTDGAVIDVLLFDRDGTLIVDRPPNDRPEAVTPMPTAAAALDLARRHACRIGVVSNQPGIAHARERARAVWRVNRAIERRTGRIDRWFICPHGVNDGCACRKPAPGLIHAALREFRALPQQAAVIGDIGADVDAARVAGVRAVLVPNDRTRREEIDSSPLVAADLLGAVRLALSLSP